MAVKAAARAGKVIVTAEGRRRREIARALGVDGYGCLDDAVRVALRKELERQELRYRAGEGSALALGIKICGIIDDKLPLWIVTAWARACTDIATRKVGSWDQVLGNERPTGKGQRRDQLELDRVEKLREILSLREHSPIKRGDPPDSFFWFAARHVGIDTAAVRKLYYKHKLNAA